MRPIVAAPAIPPALQTTAHVGPAATKAALEGLLRARRLQAEAPPLRGEEGPKRPLATGIAALDALLGGGFPRGRLSEIQGPPTSGRTGLFLALLARVTGGSALAALVDPLDRLDPASTAAAGVDLARLLWLRGPRGAGEEPPVKALADATAATATLAASGLFDVVVLDLAGADRERRRLPAATWLRLQRTVEETRTALVLVADAHVACGPGGAALALEPTGLRWSGAPGPGRLLAGLDARVWSGRAAPRAADLALTAFA
jgi:hypothetical protein